MPLSLDEKNTVDRYKDRDATASDAKIGKRHKWYGSLFFALWGQSTSADVQNVGLSNICYTNAR